MFHLENKCKKYKNYHELQMQGAIPQVIVGGRSAAEVAKEYGIPARTLYDRVKKIKEELKKLQMSGNESLEIKPGYENYEKNYQAYENYKKYEKHQEYENCQENYQKIERHQDYENYQDSCQSYENYPENYQIYEEYQDSPLDLSKR